jgi:hypothetical protein
MKIVCCYEMFLDEIESLTTVTRSTDRGSTQTIPRDRRETQTTSKQPRDDQSGTDQRD